MCVYFQLRRLKTVLRHYEKEYMCISRKYTYRFWSISRDSKSPVFLSDHRKFLRTCSWQVSSFRLSPSQQISQCRSLRFALPPTATPHLLTTHTSTNSLSLGEDFPVPTLSCLASVLPGPVAMAFTNFPHLPYGIPIWKSQLTEWRWSIVLHYS